MEDKDKKPNVIAIIGAVVLLILAVVGLSYAYFSAFVNGGEDDTTIEGTGAKLSLVYTDGKSVITSSNIMPGWSATKTFTVKNNGEGTAYYKLKVFDITNEFVEGGLTFSIASEDGGTNVDETSVGTEDRTISPSVSIGVGVTHTYTVTAKYVNLEKDQTPDLGKSFSYTIGIEAGGKSAPEGWNVASKGTLLAALRDDNVLKNPITQPGREVSAHTADDILYIQTTTLSTTGQGYYFVYGTGFEVNGKNFNLTGVTSTNDTYANSYTDLIGKYVSQDPMYDSTTSSADSIETKNLEYIFYIESATATSFTYKVLGSNENKTEALLASTEDDYGTSYYFRGSVKNNYIQFANKCWRIVRITGDGSIKLILHNDNTSGVSNPCSSANNDDSAAVTSKVVFNNVRTDNSFVGFMYGTVGASDYASTHANQHKSRILTNLETWYANNLAQYEDKLADTIWCNDKSTVKDAEFNPYNYSSTPSGLGYSENTTYYSAAKRVLSYDKSSTTSTPSLICPNDNNGGKLSKFTVDDTINGNGVLKYKIGLLTIDEVLFSGYSYGRADGAVYLAENAMDNEYYTLSSASFNGSVAYIYAVATNGLSTRNVTSSLKLRPSIALKSNIEISGGSGTSEDPYVVK